MIVLIKLFLNSKLVLIRSVKFVKQLIIIQKGGKVLLWNQVKSRMEACYSELILPTAPRILIFLIAMGANCSFKLNSIET